MSTQNLPALAEINGNDLVIVNRNGVDYKVPFYQLAGLGLKVVNLLAGKTETYQITADDGGRTLVITNPGAGQLEAELPAISSVAEGWFISVLTLSVNPVSIRGGALGTSPETYESIISTGAVDTGQNAASWAVCTTQYKIMTVFKLRNNWYALNQDAVAQP